MNVLSVQVGIGVSFLFFGLLTDGHKIQHRITLWHTEQGSDLLIGGFPLPDAIPDVDPASSKAILLYGEQDISRCDGTVLDPDPLS